MAEILTWGFLYKPQKYKWTVVNTDNEQKILDYIKSDSIIIVSNYIFKSKIKFFATLRLAYPYFTLLVENSDFNNPDFFLNFNKNNLEEIIQNSINKKFKLFSIKKRIKNIYDYLK